MIATEPAVAARLAALLRRYVADGRSTPGPKQSNDVPVLLPSPPAIRVPELE